MVCLLSVDVVSVLRCALCGRYWAYCLITSVGCMCCEFLGLTMFTNYVYEKCRYPGYLDISQLTGNSSITM